MKYSLLEMTIDILSDMDSDLVNAIGDSEESEQVARIIKSSFFEIISRKDWPHLRKTVTLENSNDTAIPNQLMIPEGTSKLEFLSYSQRVKEEDRASFKELKYLYPDEFIRKMNIISNPDNDNVDTISINGTDLFIQNDVAPTYYTSFDDVSIITDSYVEDLSTTLQGASAQCVIYFEPSWAVEDDFVPDLPSEAFPLLIAEAKSICFARIKQQIDQKAEQQAIRGNIAMSQRGWAVKGGVRYPNYGRRSGKSGGGNHFNPRQYSGES